MLTELFSGLFLLSSGKVETVDKPVQAESVKQIKSEMIAANVFFIEIPPLCSVV